MMNHIDISSVLRQTLACDLYSNLVTRSTGAAVRDQIELLLGESHDRGVVLTVIDFSQVSMIDFSCADEVVAKLLMRYSSDDPPQDAYFLFRGVSGDHWDAIEAVRVVGVLGDDERQAWEATYRLHRANALDVAIEIQTSVDDAERALDALCRRRLVMRVDGQYVAVGSARE
jgi:hypothetical protein